MTSKLTKLATAVSFTAVLSIASAFAADATAPTTTDNATTTATTPAPAGNNSATAQQPANNTAAPADASKTEAQPAPAASTGTQSDASTTPATDNTDAKAQNAQASNAVITPEKLKEFSKNAALASFTYNYQNYQSDMDAMKKYFSKEGWDSFSKALKASNNLNVVQKEKLTVSAKVNGDAKVTQNQQTATGQQWQVEVPLVVTYQNDKKQKITQDLVVKMIIGTVSTNENPAGIGINQFIAMPDQKVTEGDKKS